MPDQTSIAVVLYSLRAEGTPRLTLDLCREWTAKGVPVVVLLLFSQPDDLADEFKQGGINFVALDLQQRGLARYWRLILGIRRECKRHNVTAVVCMLFGWHLFVAAGARLAGVKRVLVHIGNRPAFGIASWLMVELARPLASVLVCCSDYVREAAVSVFALRASEAVTVPNGVAIDRWQAAKSDLTKSDIHVAMVGTLEPHKDQATLIRALPELQARAGRLAKSVTLSLVGGGSKQGELDALIRDIGLTNSVRILGTQNDIPSFLGTVDVFAFSTTDHEGQGIALVEAMAMGLPICASDVGACREVLAGGDCGVLVPPQNPSAMAQGIMRLIEQPELAQKLAQAAQARARAIYGVRLTADTYLSLCRRSAA